MTGSDADLDTLEVLLAATAHRGEPRYAGECASGPGFALGTNRLAIVDEPGGRQPFISPDRRVACVINGEIYNHRELRAELSRGYRFTSDCDAEVLLAGYLRWGAGCVPRLRGMFGLAVFDAGGGLLLARDPLGIKPLHFASQRTAGKRIAGQHVAGQHVAGKRIAGQYSRILFASELKAFAELAGVAQVEWLPPGHTWHNGVLRRYWRHPAFGGATAADATRSVPLDTALRDAVRSHLPESAAPVACLLSGGVDSSTIVALVHELHPAGAQAWTFASADTDSGDLAAAEQVCSSLGIPLHVVSPTVAELRAIYLRHGVWLLESWEPALVRNAVSYYVLCRAVRAAGHKLAFSGEGADEVFGGYDYFSQIAPADRDAAVRRSLEQIHRTYLQMADRASMFATLEVRVPYMDACLVEVAAALPTTDRFRDGVNKYALRGLYPRLLPVAVRMRAKAGMNQGAGFGSNDPGTGIYHQAVVDHYRARPRRAEADRDVAERHGEDHGVDLANAEEVYNFARFMRYGFARLAPRRPRPQLNVSRLRPAAVPAD